LGLLPSTTVATTEIIVYHNDELEVELPSTPYVGASEDGFFACGLRAKYDGGNLITGKQGFTGLRVRFCSIENWNDQEVKTVYTSQDGTLKDWVMCDRGEYIVQIQPDVEVSTNLNDLGEYSDQCS